MKSLLAIVCLVAFATMAQAQGRNLGADPSMRPRGDKGRSLLTVEECQKHARSKGLRGEERKTFVRDCRQNIRLSCREQARTRNVARDVRRDFMSSCMKGPTQPPQSGAPNVR